MIACFESTSRILAERRLRTLRELDINTARCRSMLELGKSIVHAFTYNPFDVPFALVYFCSSDYGTTFTGSTNAGSSTELGRRISLQPTHSSSTNATDKTDPAVWVYRLQDTVGIPETHPLAPKVVEINMHRYETGISDEEDEIHVWPFRKMSEQQQLIGIRELSPDVLEGIEQQGWPELPTDAIAVPIMGGQDFSRKDTMVGMLVLGINPRREFDETYQTFADMCGRQIAAAMNMVKNIEDEVARAEELATLNQERTSFFNSVSHELRTPLTLILGPLEECLEDPSLSQQHKGRLDLARRNGRRLLRLVNSLLDFSRVEAGRMTASFRETNLQRYTADLASLFRSAIEKGGVKYVVDVSGKEKKVWVDREMWEVLSPLMVLTPENCFQHHWKCFQIYS
jgi:His Kinase A (phospho-acceptor) domain